MTYPNSALKVKMTPEDFFLKCGCVNNVHEYIDLINAINEENEPVQYFARGLYEVNWVDDNNKHKNETSDSVRGWDVKNKKEAGCDYTSEWVEWLNTDEDSPWSKDPVGEKTTKLSFKEQDGLTVKTIEDGDIFNLSPDFTDRGKRTSVVFCKVLESFAEKTHNLQEKESFFKKNSLGEKWGYLKTLKTLEPWVKVAHDTIETRGKLSLNDKSVRNYSIYTFEIFERVFKEELKSAEEKRDDRLPGFKLSARAQEFVPGSLVAWGEKDKNTLPRTSSSRILGCKRVERPPTIRGLKHKKRPRTTSKNSTQHVSWQQKDLAFQELNTKIDKIIQGMETPVVQAH